MRDYPIKYINNEPLILDRHFPKQLAMHNIGFFCEYQFIPLPAFAVDMGEYPFYYGQSGYSFDHPQGTFINIICIRF